MPKNTTIKVDVEEGIHVEKFLRKFKRMCEAYGVVREYRMRKEYKKPSLKMKEKLEAAEKRRKKNKFKFSRSSKI